MSVTKRVLIIAVSGYLGFGGDIVEPVRDQNSFLDYTVDPRRTGGSEDFSIENDDEEVFLLINAFLACQ